MRVAVVGLLKSHHPSEEPGFRRLEVSQEEIDCTVEHVQPHGRQVVAEQLADAAVLAEPYKGGGFGGRSGYAESGVALSAGPTKFLRQGPEC